MYAVSPLAVVVCVPSVVSCFVFCHTLPSAAAAEPTIYMLVLFRHLGKAQDAKALTFRGVDFEDPSKYTRESGDTYRRTASNSMAQTCSNASILLLDYQDEVPWIKHDADHRHLIIAPTAAVRSQYVQLFWWPHDTSSIFVIQAKANLERLSVRGRSNYQLRDVCSCVAVYKLVCVAA